MDNQITILKNTRPHPDQYVSAFGELLSRYSWQWCVTLTVDHQASKEFMRHRFMEWKKWICIAESLQVGFALVLCQTPHCHVHALMLGSNRFGKTLEDVNKDQWKRAWIDNHHGMLLSRKQKPLSLAANQVEFVASSHAFGAYLASNAKQNDHEIEISSPRFLRKFIDESA